MLRKLMKVTIAGLLGLGAMILSYDSTSTAADEKAPDLSTIMRRSFKDKDNLKVSISTAAKDGKWDDATKLAKEWTTLGAAISKNKPPKGEAKSWEEQCMKFSDNTKAILKACEDKDAKAVQKGIGGFNCGACHKPHKQ
jgi:hypothetical protein